MKQEINKEDILSVIKQCFDITEDVKSSLEQAVKDIHPLLAYSTIFRILDDALFYADNAQDAINYLRGFSVMEIERDVMCSLREHNNFTVH